MKSRVPHNGKRQDRTSEREEARVGELDRAQEGEGTVEWGEKDRETEK